MVLDLVGVMAGAQTSPPRLVAGSPWKQSGKEGGGGGVVGAAVTGLLPIGAAGLRHSWRSGRIVTAGARTEGTFKCEPCSNKSGAGSRPEQNGGPGWCAAILGQNIFSRRATLPNYVGEAGAKRWQRNANGCLFAKEILPGASLTTKQ